MLSQIYFVMNVVVIFFFSWGSWMQIGSYGSLQARICLKKKKKATNQTSKHNHIPVENIVYIT